MAQPAQALVIGVSRYQHLGELRMIRCSSAGWRRCFRPELGGAGAGLSIWDHDELGGLKLEVEEAIVKSRYVVVLYIQAFAGIDMSPRREMKFRHDMNSLIRRLRKEPHER